MVLENVEDAKDKLLFDFDGEEEDLKDCIKKGEIQERISIIADDFVDTYTSNDLHWLLDQNNVKYVDEAIEEQGCDGILIDLVGRGQYKKNMELLNKAVKELKKEYGIEKLHKSRSYKEKLNYLRKVYLK